MLGRWTRNTTRKRVPVPLCPPQIPHDLAWFRTRVTTVGSYTILDRGTRWTWMVSLTPRLPYPQYPLGMRLGMGSRSDLDAVDQRKSSCTAGIIAPNLKSRKLRVHSLMTIFPAQFHHQNKSLVTDNMNLAGSFMAYARGPQGTDSPDDGKSSCYLFFILGP
jgi:hypothetical protein